MDINQLINDFNDTLLSLAQNIASVCPNSFVGVNIRDIEKVIRRKDNYKKFIDLFCLRVLQYKNEIDSGNDNFFMEKDYTVDLKNQETVQFGHVLSLKNVWTQLKPENKNICKMHMQILCELTQQYYNIIAN